MSIANLANIPGNAPTLLNWSFAHMDHHRQINQALQRKFGGPPLAIYPIDPIRPENLGVFLYQHQQMHNAQNAKLGVHGFNLLDVDWQDQAQLSTWIFQNFTEHRQASLALDIG